MSVCSTISATSEHQLLAIDQLEFWFVQLEWSRMRAPRVRLCRALNLTSSHTERKMSLFVITNVPLLPRRDSTGESLSDSSSA